MLIGAIPKNKKVIVMDSGVGGLTIARAIAAQHPSVNLHYIADDASFPYGAWRKDDLIARMSNLLGSAHEQEHADACVIACNTASTQVLTELRRRFKFPIVGTVPAIKPAASLTTSKRISVLATTATAKSPYLQALIKRVAQDVDVHIVAAPNLAQMAEDHMNGVVIDTKALEREIKPAFFDADARRTDTIVLGCTHYPLLIDELMAIAPWPVKWLDPANAVARQLMRVLFPSSFIGGHKSLSRLWGPKPSPRQITFNSTSGDIPPVLQAGMRELCETAALSSPEEHLKTGVLG